MTQDKYTGSFIRNFKQYHDSLTYNQYREHVISFDPTSLELINTNDLSEIMSEVNQLSYKTYYYGSLCDSQTRVVQQLEDEFERWRAEKLHKDGIDDKQYKNEKSKERYIFNTYKDEYIAFQNALSLEKYNLALLQRVVRSLEVYGYKLHDLKDYNMTIVKNS